MPCGQAAHPIGVCQPSSNARVRRASPSRPNYSRNAGRKLREKAVSFAYMFPPQDSAPGHSRNSADGKSRRSRGLCSESPFRQRSASRVVPMIVKICASPLPRQWREISSHPLLRPSSLCLSVMHPHPHPHAKSPRCRCITDGQVTDSSLIRSTSSSDGFLLMGRWYGTVVRDVEDCIREAAARGRGRDFSDIVFTSELPCNPIRTHSCLTIQQFIRSSAHSSHGGKHANVRN